MRFCNCGKPVFGTDRKTGIGYCKSCQWKRTDLDKRSILQKAIAKNLNKNEEAKIRGLIKMPANIEMINQEKWFRHVAKIIEANPYCWETGEYISVKDYRSATSHIFPKSIFKSIATHPMNFLILSPRNGSHDKTHRIDTFSKMKVFPIAIERFYLFEKEITEHHKYLNLFKEAIKNYKQ